jgi:large-conductance mechanosensitive channel
VNKLRREDVPAPAPAIPPADVQLLTEIRDLLKARAA